jgi:hypothetical protein
MNDDNSDDCGFSYLEVAAVADNLMSRCAAGTGVPGVGYFRPSDNKCTAQVKFCAGEDACF